MKRPARQPDPTPSADLRAAMNGLRRVVRGLRLQDAETSRALGLSAAQLFVLQEVAQSPGLSISRLADLTQTDPSSVSVVVTRLEGHGLVERQASASDGRRTEIRATPIGVAVMRGAPRAVQVKIIEALAALAPARLRGFVATLDEVARAMGMEEDYAPMFFEEAPPSAAPARAESAAGRGDALDPKQSAPSRSGGRRTRARAPR